MEKNSIDKYNTEIISLAEKLTKKQTGEIKSKLGVIILVYKLIKKVSKRKKKLDKEFKIIIGIKVLRKITEILKDKGLITLGLHNEILDYLDNDNIMEFVEFLEDVIEIWESGKCCKCSK